MTRKKEWNMTVRGIAPDGLDMITEVLMQRAYFTEDIAREVAMRVMDRFGFSDEIIDNVLDSDDRKLFYFLQDLEMLSTRWEETQLISGRNWRIFYWMLNKRKMSGFLEKNMSLTTGSADPYNGIPETIWRQHDAKGKA